MAASAPDGFTSRVVEVRDTWLHYLDRPAGDTGGGRPVVFLHGNPTSSFLWRHVLAALPATRRHIAVDLVGMGRSGKPDIAYTLADHISHLDGLLDALGLGGVVLVAHDWGVALAWNYLARFPDRVDGIAFMEGHLRPLSDWDALDEGGRTLFRDLRTVGVGERMVLDENFFVETLLPAAISHPLTDDELAAYRAPYLQRPWRRPLLQWAREIPIGGDPAGAVALFESFQPALVASPVPKLLVHGTPGVVVAATTVDWCRRHMTQLRVVDVGPSGHFIPEDQPLRLAATLAGWLDQNQV